MDKKKEVFTVKVDDKEVELAVVSPSAKVYREAQMEYNKVFNKLLRAGTILNQELEDALRKRGVWDDEKEAEHTKLKKSLAEAERKLASGGIRLKDAKNVAVQMRRDRMRWRELVMDRVAMQSNTAEAQAENARFNFLVQQCLVYNSSGELYYKTLDEYYDRSGEEAAIKGALKLGTITNQYNENTEALLPENKFLKDYNFIDEKLRFVNESGRLIDVNGHLIDEEGYYIDSDGNRVDEDGNKVDREGNYIVEFKPFLNDNDEPIVKVVRDTKTE